MGIANIPTSQMQPRLSDIAPSVPSRKVWIIRWILHDLGVEMLELDASIGAGEAPVYGALGRVALGFPRTHLLSKRLSVGDALIQTLASEHAQLDLGHVQPRAVFGCVMNLQLTSDAPGLGGGERFIQGGGGMGIKVVQNQHDLLGLRVVDVD